MNLSEYKKEYDDYVEAAQKYFGGVTVAIYNYVIELEERNEKMKEALEFYMKYSNDSRNMGVITTKIKEVLEDK